MRTLDLSANPRIGVVLDLVKQLSTVKTPQDVLRIYSAGMTRLSGPAGFISLSSRGLQPGEYRITRLLNKDNVTDIHKGDPWGNEADYTVHRGGLLGQIVEGGQPVAMTGLELRDDPVLGDSISHYRSLLALPMFDHGQVLNWGITLRREDNAYDLDEVERSLLQGNLVGNTVRQVLMSNQLEEAHEVIRQEVAKIAALQRALLPDPMPTVPGLSIAASYVTSQQAGGDFYDVVSLPLTAPTSSSDADASALADGGGASFAGGADDGPWGILIGDVSGHGPAAAVVMAMLTTLTHSIERAKSPADLLAKLNAHVNRKAIGNAFATAFAAVYNPISRQLTYARAGHPPPLVMTSSEDGGESKIDTLDAVGEFPIGIVDDVQYTMSTVDLQPGQTLLLYTDGITESFSPDGKLFGEEGLRKVMTDCGCEPSSLVARIRQSIETHQGGQPPQDDQTLVAMRVST